MSLMRQATKAVFWSAGASWSAQAISLLVFLVLARLLAPEAFGLIALANVAIALLTILSEQSLGEAVVQRKRIEPEHLDSAFWLQVGVALLMTAILIAAAPFLAKLFDEPQFAQILRWLSLSLIIQALTSTQVAILRRELRFKSLAVRRIAAVLASGIVGVGMAFAGYGIWSLVGQQLSGATVGTIALWGVADWRPKLRFSTKHARELISYGVYVVGSSLLTFVNRRSDDLLIGTFLGAVALGYYVVAYRILRVMTELLISVMSTVALPAFSRVESDLPRLRRGFLRALQMASLVTFPAFCWVAAAAPDVIRVFGDKWIPATSVMRVLALVGIAHTAMYLNASLFKAMGYPKIPLTFNALTATCNFVGFAIAVRWGIVAVASMYLVTNCLILPFHIRQLNRMIDLRTSEYMTAIIRPLSASLIVVLGVILTGYMADEHLGLCARLAVKIAVGAIIYVASIRFAFPFVWEESLRFIRESMAPDTHRATK